MDAIEYNKKLDADLAREGFIDEALLLNFLEAYHYDAATTVNWVSGKLRILRNRLSSAKNLSLYDMKRKVQVDIISDVDFSVWVKTTFPGIDW